MLEFTVHNWKLEPHPAMLLIPELRALLDAEKRTAEGRSQGLKNLLFVWGMVSRLSPYGDLALKVREQQVRRCVYGASDAGPGPGDRATWARILAAQEAYDFHNHTSEHRLMDELSFSLDMIVDFLRDTREKGITDGTALGKVIGSIKSIKSLLIDKRDAEKVLKEGLEKTKTKTRANAEPSPLERGFLNDVLKGGKRGAGDAYAQADAEQEGDDS
jgi:hypothetical protein